MTEQVALEIGEVEVAVPEDSLEAKFRRFHARHPHVYEHLVRLTRQMKTAGATKIGIGMLFEVIRWKVFLKTKDESGFGLCNSYRSRYARLIMEREPDLKGIFETRPLRSE